jgi:hypothetical protein
MSQLQPHLQIFTPPTTHGDESYFHRFPELPIELRQKIWRHSLQRERLIRIRLVPEPNAKSTIGNERYTATVNGHQVLSKLLRVNREPREAALGFYRVHIPCRFAGIRKDVALHGMLVQHLIVA